jgi:hypothetical protein
MKFPDSIRDSNNRNYLEKAKFNRYSSNFTELFVQNGSETPMASLAGFSRLIVQNWWSQNIWFWVNFDI